MRALLEARVILETFGASDHTLLDASNEDSSEEANPDCAAQNDAPGASLDDLTSFMLNSLEGRL